MTVRDFGRMLVRGVLRRVDPDGETQRLQVEALAGDIRDNREHAEPYGFTAHPLPGAEVIAAALGGSANHTVILVAYDGRHRPPGLAAGEVCIYDDQGQEVRITRDGIIITSSKKVRIDGPAIEIHAEQSLKLDVGGYGETWLTGGRKTWTQGTTSANQGPPAPPEHP